MASGRRQPPGYAEQPGDSRPPLAEDATFAAPPQATEVYVVGKQWMWKFQNPDGRREINALHIPIGTPMKLMMISEDVIHSL